MALETVLSDVPITLPYPWDHPAPEPTPGCDVCGALQRQIEDAEDPDSPQYSLSRASDYRVEMARHQRGEVAS